MNVIDREILFGELAFVERGTNKLFVPLTIEYMDDGRTVLRNAHFVSDYDLLDERFIQISPAHIFKFDPRTLLHIG